MVDTKKFIGNNIRVVKTSDGLKSFVSVDDCRELIKEIEKCYSEIADKEAIIAEYGRGTFTDMKGNFFFCEGTVHFSGMGAVGASPIKKLV